MEETICKGCDFYSVIPTLIEGEQLRKPLCNAGKSIEDEVINSCVDYEERNPLRREEKEQALLTKVKRDDNLVFNDYPVRWSPFERVDYGYAEPPSLRPPDLQPPNLHIPNIEAVKQFLSRDYILRFASQFSGLSHAEISDRVFRGIKSVLQNEFRETWRRYNIRCNTLILSEEYYYSLLHLLADMQPNYPHFGGQPSSVQRFLQSVGILNVVVCRNNSRTIILVFDPLLCN